MKALTKVTLHGELGKVVGDVWNVAVSSVGEAMRAIEVLSRRRLFSYLAIAAKDGIKYKIIINGKPFYSPEPLDPEKPDSIFNSELTMSFLLKTVDVIPVIEGAGGGGNSDGMSWITIVLAVVIIIIGAYTSNPALIMVGIGLLAAGVINLISKAPKFDDFRTIQGGGRVSYLFNGPENTVGEGGPVPIAYGRLIAGSQVVSASYEVSHKNADDNALTS
jgi:predicted phage tail protein